MVKQNDLSVEIAPKRSKAEERMIRVMTKRGGKGFRILRSAEMPIKQYRREQSTSPGKES